MRWVLRYQLLVPPVILLLAVAGITAWTAVASAERARSQLEARTRSVVETLTQPRGFDLNKRLLDQMKDLTLGAEFIRVRGDGSMIGTLDVPAASLPPAQVDHSDLDALKLGPRIEVDGKVYFCSGIRLQPPWWQDERLYVLYPEALWKDALWEAIWPSLVLGGFLGLAAVGLAIAVGQRLTRRIQELERRTRQIADGDFSPMPLPRRDDELRDLGRSVNEMAQRLAHLQETVQKTERLRLLGQVGGGLAHQLRNGVAGARLAVQLYLREAGETNSDALEVALRQLTLVESNLKRFLDLGSAPKTVRQACSISALVEEAVTLVQPQARHAGIDLRWQKPDAPLTVQGDPGQLQQLLLNVSTNALEAAGPGGWVSVNVRATTNPAQVVIEVSDSGPGPVDAVASRLFEPFVTGKAEGVGLGLAVSRHVAEAHGGAIAWSRDGDHTSFRITLPAVAAATNGKVADVRLNRG